MDIDATINYRIDLSCYLGVPPVSRIEYIGDNFLITDLVSSIHSHPHLLITQSLYLNGNPPAFVYLV